MPTATSAEVHPELRRGEMFYKNMPRVAFDECAWKSKRMGRVAYWMQGDCVQEPITSGILVPVFIKKAELSRDALDT